MADGNITVEVSTQAALAELERLRAENAALKRDLEYARSGLTNGRSRMREDIARLQAALDQKHAEYEDLKACAANNARNLAIEAHTWSKAAETYAADAERYQWLRQRYDVLCRMHTAQGLGLDVSAVYVRSAEQFDGVIDAAMQPHCVGPNVFSTASAD